MEQAVATARPKQISSRSGFAFIYALIILIEMPLMATMSIDGANNWAYSYSILIIFNLIIQTIFLYRTTGLVNFLYAFVSLYYVFHFGQVIMLGLFPWYEYDYVNYITTYMSRRPEYIKETMILCVNCINLFVLGALLYNPKTVYYKKKSGVTYNYKKVCKYAFLILFSFRFLLDALALFLSFYFGYEGTFDSFVPGVISALGVMGYGIIPLYYLSLDQPKKRNRFLIFILLYLGITMLSGNRAYQVICIIGIFIVYVSQNKITPNRFVLMAFMAFLGLVFIDFIFDMRGEGFNAFLKSNTNVYDGSSKNVIFETIGSFGETIYTPYLVFENYKAVSPFWGECFFKSLATIVPDVFGYFKDINNEAVFPKMVSNGHTIGGSFAGEMYYNF